MTKRFVLAKEVTREDIVRVVAKLVERLLIRYRRLSKGRRKVVRIW